MCKLNTPNVHNQNQSLVTIGFSCCIVLLYWYNVWYEQRLCCSLFCLQLILILFTEDITPPSLQWVGSTPSQTNGSIILSWTTDEAVTSLCTVYSPVKATDVSCNNKWVGTELRHGEYSLTVKMVDGSGNKAEAVHRWNNSKFDFFFFYNNHKSFL